MLCQAASTRAIKTATKPEPETVSGSLVTAAEFVSYRPLHDELHSLDVTDRVRFKLAVLTYRCLHGTAPPYLMDSCTLTADVTGRQRLRSATQRKLIVPRYRLNAFGRRRFAVAGPSTWNSLPDSLRDTELSLNTFKRQLKTYILRRQNVLSAL